MNILHINTLSKGGAAKACIRLHLGLLEEGLRSNLLTLDASQQSILNSFQYIKLKKSYPRRIIRRLYRTITEIDEKERHIIQFRPKGFELFSFATSPHRIQEHPFYKRADIINLHWISGFLDYSSFFKNVNKPVVWTLHDMNPFTGGCHYAGDCFGFQKICSDCPQLKGTIDANYAATMLEKKLNSLKHGNCNLIIAAPSKWLFQQSQKSKLFQKIPHILIPYGLPEQFFFPQEKNISKQKLNISPNKKVILFVSDSVENKRKGFDILLNSLSKIDRSFDFVLCAVGHLDKENIKNVDNLHLLGSISDESTMSTIYSAADVFVIPSLEDNLPNTVLESLMCGTPVIGFNIGGISDMIVHGENGYLVNQTNSDALAEAINKFLSGSDPFDRGVIRNEAVKNYALRVQAKKYIQLYQEILNKS
ncbi:glycosyl transferase group 1 [Chloroherpeton thalassium ATCC 35110]|uniref:Glycosyl transferase group 1 n=1 Tax=Chloroherpeton thalassium (strain ATCC 35110 / GB-78) TaxID=517418 RepID=B3QXP8_CHLT3|nr:glycosyltransferase [Chloroherpeton thalassium]ACF14963.1 glycosyl transferase group 1 [Chloroherpeton thalassium ATCC 35110]